MTCRLLCRTSAVLLLLFSSACNANQPPGTAKEGEQPAKKADASSADQNKASRITSKVDVSPVDTLTDEESREVSFAAGRILKHIAQARAAIAVDHKDDARKHVDQGLKLIEIIESVLPHYSVKTEIRSGDLVYTDHDEITPTYVTLFDELERRDIITPVLRAKSDVKQKSSNKANDANNDAAKGVEEHSQQPPQAVSLAANDYTIVKLNVGYAKEMLNLAKTEMAKESHKEHLKADTALLAIQTAGVTLEFDEIDLPLERAADNLKLAETEMKEGRYDAAKETLYIAADELKKYEKQAGENRSKEVKALHEEIGKLAAELEKGKPSEADAEKHINTISKLWQKVTKWFKSQ